MTFTKTLLTGISFVSFCMGNISGIVTDTGTTPLEGVVVQLENGGQAVTTGADGRFTLGTSTTQVNERRTPLLKGLSAEVIGNLITVDIAERSVVKVETFDLNGKLLSTVRNTLDAGCHTLLLPHWNAGIYLHRVKSGDRECMVKGNTIIGTTSGNVISSQGSSSGSLTKQTFSKASVSDIIAAKKNGYLNYRMIVTSFDTNGIVIKLVASAGKVTDVDGNVYQTVKIGDQEWMVENLRVTKYNDGSAIPMDTSKVTWKTKTPKFCYYNNKIDEDSIKKYGALYNWYVISPENPKKVAPSGWHVPDTTDWNTLHTFLITHGYNWDGTLTGNKIAKSLASKTDWHTPTSGYDTIKGTIYCNPAMNNASGFSALPAGMRSDEGEFGYMHFFGFWWTATENKMSSDYAHRYILDDIGFTLQSSNLKSWGLAVRLLRD